MAVVGEHINVSRHRITEAKALVGGALPPAGTKAPVRLSLNPSFSRLAAAAHTLHYSTGFGGDVPAPALLNTIFS